MVGVHPAITALKKCSYSATAGRYENETQTRRFDGYLTNEPEFESYWIVRHADYTYSRPCGVYNAHRALQMDPREGNR